ncbi:FAD:protein FMN transferase [Arenibacter certesii]|uniref:FAD:protein FMN transferase n=2 Tax=Arenibacter certesii TaxID=228955 RepID=A0A918IWZ1_9FLAO|nr:FAD:protein FMN transferase [Arenibacter certesii]
MNALCTELHDMKITNPFLLSLLLLTAIYSVNAQKRVSYTHQQMGTQIRLVFYSPDSLDSDRVAQVIFDRIDELNLILSDYLPHSEINRLVEKKNANVEVSGDLYNILKLSEAISRKTDGAFDVSMGPVITLWRNARKNGVVPTEQEIEAAKNRSGFEKIRILPKSVVNLSTAGMQLDLGGIGKGYAADEAIALLKKLGVRSALVDMGGDITVSDAPPNKAYWILGFSYYDSKNNEVFTKLKLKNQAVATSGDLYQYFNIDGNRYSHIVDPKTGRAITNNIQVTTIAPNGTMADAYASALSVLGIEKSKYLLKTTPGLEAILVADIPEAYQKWNTAGFLDYIVMD